MAEHVTFPALKMFCFNRVATGSLYRQLHWKTLQSKWALPEGPATRPRWPGAARRVGRKTDRTGTKKIES